MPGDECIDVLISHDPASGRTAVRLDGLYFANGVTLGPGDAYVLVNEVRRVGLAGTQLARAQVGTIRTRLLKVSGVVKLSVRRVRVALASAFPHQGVFAQALIHLQRTYPLRV